jgi:large subunit ribosomal protein L23
MNPYEVLIKPMQSEKTNKVLETERKYTFVVNKEATKADVKSAVEALWGVKVTQVNTVITRGKVRRRGMHPHLSTAAKKAIVALAEGQSLPIFEVK